MSTEKPTQRKILKYLKDNNIFHYRQNGGAFKTRNGFYRFASMNGLPDIVAVVKGRYIAIEVKDVKGRQNNAQKVFQRNFEKAGGVYILAKSVDDVIAFFRKIL